MRSTVALVVGLLLAAFPAPSASAAEVPDVGFVVAFDPMPRDLRAGDAFEGGRVDKVDSVLRYARVTTRDPASFEPRAASRPDVRYVEVDALVPYLLFTPNDPAYATQQYAPQQVNADDAWATTLGDAATRICILDTGARTTHQEFAGRIVAAWDFADDEADVADDHGHGTHVASIAAAGVNDGKGIAGMGNVGIMIGDVFVFDGAFPSDVADGIRWCADNGADVISMSLGNPSPSTVQQDAMRYALGKGALVFAAAGNGGPCSDCVLYPAAFPEAIAVTCTTSTRAQCSFSSDGPESDLAAPGNAIYAASRSSDTAYTTMSGTSMSTPAAAGVAALVKSRIPDATPAQLRAYLEENAQDEGAAGWDELYGHGIVDAGAAMAALPPPVDLVPWYAEAFDDGAAQGWTTTGLWHVDSACATARSLPNYLGYHDAQCDYDVLLSRTSGSAAFDVDLTAALTGRLEFDHTFDVEDADSALDVMTVDVSPDGGATWTTLLAWDARDGQKAWTRERVNLDPFLGGTVRLRFTFDSMDALSNAFPGWKLDDVRVLAVDNYPPVARAGPDVATTDGDADGLATVTLDGRASSDANDAIASWTWTEGGTVVATGAAASAAFAVGTHDVLLTVADGRGATHSDAVRIVVGPNAPPVARAGSDAVDTDHDGDGAEDVAVSGSASTDADGTLVAYAWREAGQVLATTATATLRLPVGVHTLTLEVTDDGGATASDAVVLDVRPNAAPVASFTASCSGRACTFDGRASSDTGGPIASWSWDLGDGATATGPVATHTYAADSNYAVTLTVADAAGAVGTLLKNVPVGGSETTLFLEEFDDGAADGMTLTGLWHVDSACDAAPPSPPKYLGYHRTTACDYDAGRTTGSATFGVDLRTATDGYLVFTHRWATESGSTYDVKRLQVNSAGSWVTVKSFVGASQPWTEYRHPLTAYAGNSIQVRFFFDTMDSTSNAHAGWYVDSLRAVASVPPQPPVAVAGPDVALSDDDGDGLATATLDGSASSDPDGSIVAWEWREGDVVLGTTPGLAVDLAVGTHDVVLRVTDDTAAVGTDTVRVVVAANPAPVAIAGPDTVVTDDDGNGLAAVLLDGSASSDGTGSIALWSWSDGTGVVASTPTADLVLGVGSYAFTLTVTDNGGRTAADDVLVRVDPNPPPVANAGADARRADTDGSGDEAFVLDGGGSYDGTGLLVHEWLLGDVLVATGATPTVTMPLGVNVVTLRVTDDGGANSTDNVTLTVDPNVGPVAVAGPDQVVYDVERDGAHPVELDGRASADPVGTIALYEWLEGEALLATGPTPVVSLAVGPHLLTLRVTDDGGLTALDDLVADVYDNDPPTAVIKCCCVDLACSFDATGSSDPNGPIVAYAWDFGDGTTATGALVDHRFATPGLYTVTLTVTDDVGVSDQAIRAVDVRGSTRTHPIEVPADPHVRDQGPATPIENAPQFDVEAAWFDADADDLWVGLKLRDIPAVADASAHAAYVVAFRPDWTPADPTWGGRAGAGETVTALRVFAQEQVGTNGRIVHWYELQVQVRNSRGATTTSKLWDVEANVDADTDIVSWKVPRSRLQAPPGGAHLLDPRALAYASARNTIDVSLQETTPVGRAFEFPCGRASFTEVDPAPETGPGLELVFPDPAGDVLARGIAVSASRRLTP